MKNKYPYLPDRQLEPDDNSVEEAAAERAEEDTWEALFEEDVWQDMLEEYEDEGELPDMVSAYRKGKDADLLDAARRMAAKIEAIARKQI